MENYIIDQQITGRIYNPEDIMYKDFERCTFMQCDLSACSFTGVAFIDCNFISCNFSEAKINYVGLRGAIFDNCNFTGVNFSMVDKLFFSVEFKNCRLDHTKF
ncbi:pentapeptide repeat-containing protein [Flavobacterium sp.]